MSDILKKFKRDIKGLLGLAAGIFLALSLWSYTPQDPSLSSWVQVGRVKNYCGYIGSFLSDFLYQTLGLSSWLLVVVALWLSFKNFRSQTSVVRTKGTFFIGGLLLTTVSSLCALYLPSFWNLAGSIPAGGQLGFLVSQGLVKILNPIGVGVVLWTSMILLLVFYSERSLSELFYLLKKISLFHHFKLKKQDSIFHVLKKFFFNKNKSLSMKKVKALQPVPSLNVKVSLDQLKIEPLSFQKEEVSLSQTRRKVQLSVPVPRKVEHWTLPQLALLQDPPVSRARWDEKEVKNKARLLVEKLAQFSIQGEVVGIKPGPAVTMFEFKPAADVKISRITDLADDLSLALSSESVRIVAPIPGRDVVGIETSNSQREAVYLKDIVAHESFWDLECKLPLALGRRADGEPRVVDLRKMPHLLVAGTTGSGKSVFVVSALVGLLFRHSPQTLKLILIDPKQVDLAAFHQIPHLLMPPLREPQKAVGALRWAIREMEKRYRSMAKFGARGLESFNQIVSQLKAEEIKLHEEETLRLTQNPSSLNNYYFVPLPYIVIVVEEFGDLMAVDRVNVEQAVVRLAQMARACGIHLILAMQSPRRDVVTGLIKTNIPGRMSFKVASKMDSRIILDEAGAERLLARGDMLFLAPGVAKPDRHHGPYLSESEISAVVSSWREQGGPEFDSSALKAVEGSPVDFDDQHGHEFGFSDEEDIKDEKYDEILAHVATLKEVSASLLQRKFRLGYPRAARMIEIFEAEGVVGPAQGSKPRPVLIAPLSDL